MKNKIIIVAGDPNSINSELIYKVWKKVRENIKKNIYIIGNYELISKQFKLLNLKIKLQKIYSINELIKTKNLKIIDIPLKFKDPFKVPFRNSSKYILESIDFAHKLSMKKKIRGFINCPVDKKLLKTKNMTGVTELLALKSGIKNSSEVMLIHNKKLSVVPITTHVDIKKISKHINRALIINKVSSLSNCYKKLFKKKPKIAILGLNPHNSELVKYSEEKKIIIPSIKKLKKLGLNINGPFVADTFFIEIFKEYDVVVGMYHDQVLSPFKAMFKFNAINLTLGLNYLRASPDHGPAINLIKKNKANYSSLLECVRFFNFLN